MAARHRRTLEAIFARPTRTDLRLDSVAALLGHLGATRYERSGSRIAFVLAGVTIVMHRPHGDRPVNPSTVRDLRRFLIEAGHVP
jgi:hypothetical protein